MESSNAIRGEQASSAGGVKAMPAVRAMARKLRVDLSRVRGTGADGVVTMADVKQAAADGTAKAEIGRASCRERVCQYGWTSVVAGSLKKKQQTKQNKETEPDDVITKNN